MSPGETIDTTATSPASGPPATGGLLGADSRSVGRLCLGLSLLFLVVGGLLGVVLRSQLAQPDLRLVDRGAYRQLLTAHGTFSFFLFLLPAWIGLAFAVVPLQIGAARLAFPRMAAFTVWLFAAAGAMLLGASVVLSRPLQAGWALDAARFRRGVGGNAPELWVLGLGLAAIAVVLGAVNLLTTLLKLRAPGLTTTRLPLFSWSVLVSSAMLLVATPVLLAGLVLLFVEHHYGGRSFNMARGGDPLVWQQLFWFFAHPARWALVLAGLGVVAEIVPVFARRPLVRSAEVRRAMAGAGVMAFLGWGLELAGDRSVPGGLFALSGLLVLAPVTVVAGSCLATVRGARGQGAPPARHAVAVLSLLLAGLAGAALLTLSRTGRTGVSTYWWVGTWHALVGGVATLGVVTAVTYWAPKLWGRHMVRGLSALQLLLLAGGTHLMVMASYVLGLQRMPRGTSVYRAAEGWGPANLAATAGSCAVAAGALVFVLNVIVSSRRGPAAEENPWGGGTLEWATASPPPPHNFDRLPEVRSDRPLADLQQSGPPSERQPAGVS